MYNILVFVETKSFVVYLATHVLHLGGVVICEAEVSRMREVVVTVSTIYRNGLGAIITSLGCSVCTCVSSQLILALTHAGDRSVEIQTALSVSIFVFGYWGVYFLLRQRIHAITVKFRLAVVGTYSASSNLAKLIFVGISEVFWIVTLTTANYWLLAKGFSPNTSAAIAQWGINLLIWLPLLPAWEWFALCYLPLFTKKVLAKIFRD